MALDPNTQKFISVFIQNQFPRFYEEYGQTFIRFVEAYYEWMETEGPLYDSRRASDYQDIDTTVDRFIIYFKNKYLQNIQLETRSNVELLVKHSLDVYRSRGTIRSIDLLFRLVFGVGADVYYPFDDVIQPSSGEWIIPRYIEVSTQDDLNKFVGREILGVTSGAQAFVESWVRKKAGSKQLDILYISVLEGNFVLGERINTVNTPFNLLECPSVIGSLTNINIIDGATGFDIGDILEVKGPKGYGAKARVANVQQATGKVSFTLTDGGYGYTANSSVLVSEEVLTLANVIPGNIQIGTRNYFHLFEQITQPMANINYESANNGWFANNDTITTYFANGTVKGTGVVLAASIGNSTNGQIMVAVLSGNLQSNMIYSQGNAVFASVPVSNGYNDRTATGNVISESDTATITVKDVSGSFIRNERLVTSLSNTFATMVTFRPEGAFGTLAVKDRVGVWNTNTTITGTLSGATANIVSIALNVGVIDINNDFRPDSRAPFITTKSGTTAITSIKNRGVGASFQISPILLYPETIALNTDLVADYLTVPLNSSNYGFPPAGAETLSTVIGAALTNINYTIGRISGLVSITPGSDYTVPPMARVYEPIVFGGQYLKNKIITFTGANGNFLVNDVITQSATGARGLVQESNTTVLKVQMLSLFNQFTLTSNSTTKIVANTSGVSANVVSYENDPLLDVEDLGQIYLGMNADLFANTTAANGNITSMQVINSGWGYEQGESLVMTKDGIVSTGEAVLLNQGIGEGFYRTEGGFLSDIKKIHDNDYYQVASYDIRASVSFDHYVDMLKSLLHVAGTKAFGTFLYRTTANVQLSVIPAKIIQT